MNNPNICILIDSMEFLCNELVSMGELTPEEVKYYLTGLELDTNMTLDDTRIKVFNQVVKLYTYYIQFKFKYYHWERVFDDTDTTPITIEVLYEKGNVVVRNIETLTNYTFNEARELILQSIGGKRGFKYNINSFFDAIDDCHSEKIRKTIATYFKIDYTNPETIKIHNRPQRIKVSERKRAYKLYCSVKENKEKLNEEFLKTRC